MSIDWTAVSGIATGVASLATAAAAIATAWMAGMTKKSLQQAERLHNQGASQVSKHHQDSFRPICVLENYYGPDDPYLRDGYLTVKRYGQNDLLISAQLRLKNVGAGPALGVRLVLLFPQNNPESGHIVELAPLPANGDYGDEQTPIRFRLSMQNYTDHKFGFNLPPNETNTPPIDAAWEIVLEYEDIFGNKFHTAHTRNALAPWTKIGTGEANLPKSIRKELERLDRINPRAFSVEDDLLPYLRPISIGSESTTGVR